ncbi:MAG: hypothetical protein E7523_05205 [Ruminococcaceae bacterium]|nr:hypothetical protein [Oscillospiraceae bacterium]
MKKTRRIISLLLALTMLCSCFLAVTANAVEKEEMYPSIVIPGLFQGRATLYENGEIATTADGEPLEAPFFLSGTEDIIGTALKIAGIPLLTTLMTQRDHDLKFANALGTALGEILLGKIKSDENGKFIYDVRPEQLNTAVSNLTEEQKNYVYDTIPLTTYKEIAGEDKLYFFTYFSFENMDTVTERLYNLIQTVKAETGYDKVNIVPISQGGSICNSLLETYKDQGIFDDLNRIVYVIPALDGSYTLGDIYYHGLLDDDEALYNYMFPLLLDGDQEWLGYLINTLIKIFPKKVLNDVLDIAVNILIEDYLEYSTMMWGLIPSEYYPELRERHLMDEDNAILREQTDRYYQAQCNREENILTAIENGVEVFDIVNYNDALYPICDNWNKCQADGIIQLESTSIGAYGIGVDVQLPEGYVQQNTNPTCSDPENHVHIDPYNLLDASTGLIPDTTFYFYNGDHEQTGRNDIVMRLVVDLLTDPNFKDVYTYEKYPQFNTARKTRGAQDKINSMKVYLTDESVDPAVKERLAGVIDRAQALYDDTACTPEEVAELESCLAEFDAIRRLITTGSEEVPVDFGEKLKNAFLAFLTKVLKFFNDVRFALVGGRGFVDIPGYNA